MFEIQRFGLQHIYCAPSQDRQYHFSLVKVTKKNLPVKRIVQLYNVTKPLPDATSYFHVFVIGNLNPSFLNLLSQHRSWYRDVWNNAAKDMNDRNFIFQVYNDDGVMFPREFVFYNMIDESSIAVAIRIDPDVKYLFPTETFKYLRVYSNDYFQTEEFNASAVKHGVKVEVMRVVNNVDKVSLQNKINTYKQAGGDVMVYVNGYYTDNLNLNIENNSYIEYVYDQSILSKEKYVIGDLRTFESTKDNKLKYLLFRQKIVDSIQYDDDNEIYVSNDNQLVTKGIFFYEHKEYAVRTVTDKDYSLYTSFVNNQASKLSAMTTGAIQDKILVVYTRKSGINRPLVYSSLKLHELYKLPQSVEHDVLTNMNYTIPELRADTLESSDYFKLANTQRLKDITKELCTSAVGYNGVSYYYGYSPVKVDNAVDYVEVPMLYHKDSYAYEYDQQGKLLGKHLTTGPLYTIQTNTAKQVEFVKGVTPNYYSKLYLHNESVELRDSEYKLLSAYYDGVNRISDWGDITEHPTKVTINGNVVQFHETEGKKIRVFYLDEPLTYTTELSLVDGTLYFPLTVEEDRGTGVQLFPMDLPFSHIEVFLNNHRLAYKLDWFLNFPQINICNKKYLKDTSGKQTIHIRCHGFTLDKSQINTREIRGFVSHGALTRNNYYDIRDDKVFSVFIDGKLYDRSNVIYSEEDNTVRTIHDLNGLPYTIAEPLIPLKEVTGMPTLAMYESNNQLNKKISDLFNIVFKEPTNTEMNAIENKHILFSPLVTKIAYDMLDGNISPILYTTPYNDATIINLLESNYKGLYNLDPIKHDLNFAIVELHPHPNVTTMALNLHQFRFLTNLVRIITQGQANKIVLSGHTTITTDNTPIPTTPSNQTGGIIVL